MYFLEVISRKDKKYFWHLLARNGRIIADSGQGYTRRDNAIRAADKFCAIVKGRVTCRYLQS